MGWFDSYGLRLSLEGACGDERMNMSSQIIGQNFRKMPSYREAFLTNLDEITTDLDVCIINTDKAEEKEAVLLPETKVETGNYISFRDTEGGDMKTHLVLDFEYNLVSPKAQIKECEFEMSLPHRQRIPILMDGDSYGTKILSNTDFINSTDAKVKVTLPDTLVNRQYLDQNIRFCVNHSKHGIYKVGSIDMYSRGLIVLTCQKDKYMDGLDDLDTGIMFQYDESDNEPEIEYTLEGASEIVINKEEVYTCSENATFALDDYTFANGLAFIADTTPNSCTIRGAVSGESITLIATVGTQEITKDIDIVRW